MWWCSSRLALLCLALLLLQGHLSSAKRGGRGWGRRFGSSRRFGSKYSSSYKPSRSRGFGLSSRHGLGGRGSYGGIHGEPDWSPYYPSAVYRPRRQPLDPGTIKTCREVLGIQDAPTHSALRREEERVPERKGARGWADTLTTLKPTAEGSQPNPTTAKSVLTTEENKKDVDFVKIMKDVEEWTSRLLKETMTPLCEKLRQLQPEYFQVKETTEHGASNWE